MFDSGGKSPRGGPLAGGILPDRGEK